MALIYVYDNFNRPDESGTLGFTPTGQEYFGDGSYGIANNQAYSFTTTKLKTCFFDVGVSDCIIESDVIFSEFVGLTFRYKAAGGHWYFQLQTGEAQLVYYKSGANLAGSTPFATTIGQKYRIKIALNGSLIRCYIDNTLLLEVTDIRNVSETSFGLNQYTTGSPTADTWENLIIREFTEDQQFPTVETLLFRPKWVNTFRSSGYRYSTTWGYSGGSNEYHAYFGLIDPAFVNVITISSIKPQVNILVKPSANGNKTYVGFHALVDSQPTGVLPPKTDPIPEFSFTMIDGLNVIDISDLTVDGLTGIENFITSYKGFVLYAPSTEALNSFPMSDVSVEVTGKWLETTGEEPPPDTGIPGEITLNLNQTIHKSSTLLLNFVQKISAEKNRLLNLEQVVFQTKEILAEINQVISRNGMSFVGIAQTITRSDSILLNTTQTIGRNNSSFLETNQVITATDQKFLPLFITMRDPLTQTLSIDLNQIIFSAAGNGLPLNQNIFILAETDVGLEQTLYKVDVRTLEINHVIYKMSSRDIWLDIQIVLSTIQLPIIIRITNDQAIIGNVYLQGEVDLYQRLTGGFDLYQRLQGGVNVATRDQDIQIFSGDTKNIIVTLDETVDFTDASFKWGARSIYKAKENVIAKSSENGITIVGNEIHIRLDPVDTQNLSGPYFHELELTDGQENVSTVLIGKLIVEHSGV